MRIGVGAVAGIGVGLGEGVGLGDVVGLKTTETECVLKCTV